MSAGFEHSSLLVDASTCHVAIPASQQDTQDVCTEASGLETPQHCLAAISLSRKVLQ